MNIEIIGAAIEAVYYAGRPKVDKKMTRKDFVQLARMANGTIMRSLYFKFTESGENIYLYFAEQIDTREFEVGKADSRGRRSFDLEKNKDIFRLPNGVGIFSISATGDEDCACEGNFRPAEVGSEWLYCNNPDYSGVKFHIKKGNKIYLYNAPKCMNKVEVDGIFNDDKIDIPEDIAFDIVNAVLSTVLQTAGFPIDKTDDNNPNVTTIKKALAEPSSL